jgi:hypothetical protein
VTGRARVPVINLSTKLVTGLDNAQNKVMGNTR